MTISVETFGAFGTLFREYGRVASEGALSPKLARSMRRALERSEELAGTLERRITSKQGELTDVAEGHRLIDELAEARITSRSLIDDLPTGKPKGGLDGRLYADRLQGVGDAFTAADEIVHAGIGVRVPTLPAVPAAVGGAGIDAAEAEARIAKLGLDEATQVRLAHEPALANGVQKVAGSKLLQRLLRIKVVGAEHVPASGPVVLVPTHTGAGDIIHSQMGHQRVPRVMAHAGLFGNRLGARLLRSGGAVPVTPNNSRAAMSELEANLLRGNAVKVYGEGMMPRVDALGPTRRGAALLAIRAKAPVVVEGEYGTRRAAQYGEGVLEHWTHKGGRGAVLYSEPIPTAHLDPRNSDHVTALAAHIGDVQAQLREQGRQLLGH
ncbi:MAG: 1-acyl-sn-glycerol-3-phosphate acyltransferase [Thermoleophilia bacterium]|nr:1-acyl-sn-glycerol-3-phosphate acyltransferase [Thermoleophilia bacterium]